VPPEADAPIVLAFRPAIFLAAYSRGFSFEIMKSALFGRITAIVGVLLFLNLRTFGDSMQVDAENFKRLAGEVADLRDANAALQLRVTQLLSKTDALQEALREANERAIEKFDGMASRDDLSKVAEKFREIDQKREADRQLIFDQFEELRATLAQTPEPSPQIARKNDLNDKQVTPRPTTTNGFDGKVISYKIEPGDMLEKVLRGYNQRLKEDGRPRINTEQVLAANPGLNPDNLKAGKEIQLPVPDKASDGRQNVP